MTPPTVLVTSRSFGTGACDVRADLETAGFRVVTGPADHDPRLLGSALSEASAWIAGTAPITEAHLGAAPHLRLIARYGVGVDSIDLAAAERHGVLVTNTPGANSAAVADHTVALMLTALRRIPTGDRRVRRGDWRVERTRELGGLTVGLIGFGRIGRAVAARLAGFGSAIAAHDPGVPDPEVRALGVEPVGMAELASRCDIVSLHAPGEEALIESTWLASARPGLFLVNAARACLVDEVALAEALADGRIGGYAADTLAAESRRGGGPLLHEDLADRTVFTPHTAAQTVEAVDGMGIGAARAVLAVLRDETPPHLVPSSGCAGSPREATRSGPARSVRE